METKDKEVSKPEESKTVEVSEPKQEEDFVKRSAYEDVSKDMHKFKSKAKNAEAELTQLKAEKKADEESRLKEQNDWKELYEREKQGKEELESVAKQQQEEYIKTVKLSALKSELGGNVKDQYLNFADVGSIQRDEDGSLNSDSVQLVANKFRQEHPDLVGKQGNLNITGPAPTKGGDYREPENTVANMSIEEKKAKLHQIRNEKYNCRSGRGLRGPNYHGEPLSLPDNRLGRTRQRAPGTPSCSHGQHGYVAASGRLAYRCA